VGQETKKTQVSPARVSEDFAGGWRSRTLVAAIELDIFRHIAEGKRTSKEIAVASGSSQRGIQYLLDVLVAMQYLRRAGGRYGLQPVARAFLVPGKMAYMGALTEQLSLAWDIWKHLTQTVKTGRPHEAVNIAEKGKEFYPKLVASIFPGNFATATEAVSHFTEKERRKIHKILDVAAGSGAWSLAFAQAISDARVTSVDFSEMTPITRGFAEKFGVAERYEYLEGDLRKVDFGRDTYDLVILGHIIHSEGEKHGKELLRKSYGALRLGGKLLIAEYVPNDARTGPLMPMLFSLTMLLHTDEGNVFTMREYRAWLAAVGFRKVATLPVPPPSTLILATK
jgi:ubiquinone/menaquinone biosynthesis C-methylase UbiE